jgi:hypothetical protein
MTTEVWKYSLTLTAVSQRILMPAGAELLHLQLQYGQPVLWVRVDKQQAPVERYFQFVGTGFPVHPNSEHVGTVLLNLDTLVLHLFEVHPAANTVVAR